MRGPPTRKSQRWQNTIMDINGNIDLSQLLIESHNCFARCKCMGKEANISSLRKTFTEEEPLNFCSPILICCM